MKCYEEDNRCNDCPAIYPHKQCSEYDKDIIFDELIQI